jgi:hypothetical protein
MQARTIDFLTELGQELTVSKTAHGLRFDFGERLRAGEGVRVRHEVAGAGIDAAVVHVRQAHALRLGERARMPGVIVAVEVGAATLLAFGPARVLAPVELVRHRPVVAVGVDDRNHPDFARVDELLDRAVGGVAVGQGVQQRSVW